MSGNAQSKMRIVLWRLSIAAAALLIAISLWFATSLMQIALLFSGLLPEAVKWGNVAIELMVIGVVGVIAPGLYIRWAWGRAFPRRLRRSPH